jgi:type II secretory pathway component GspD/PulD (secretin)
MEVMPMPNIKIIRFKNLLIQTLIIAALFFPAAAFAVNTAQIKNITVQEFPDKDQVVIGADMPITFHEMKSSSQIILDIPNSEYISQAKVQLVLNKTVKLYRGMNLQNSKPKTSRIIIVLNEPLPTTVYKQNNQIIIDVDKTAIIQRIEAATAGKTSDEKMRSGSNTLVEYHYNQGKTFSRLGKWNEAVDEYLKALKIDPANDKIKIALDVAKNNLKSEKEIDKAVRLYQNGEYNEAIRAFVSITNMWPQDISAHFYLGKSYLKLNKYREAVIEFEKVMEINPEYENVVSLYELSKRRKQLNNFTVEINNQDILDVLRTILHGSGFNLVAEDGVKKKISVALVDKTIDEALNEIIIKNGYKYEKIDNTIKIMPNIAMPEDRVYSQMNLVDMEIGHGLEVLSRLMEKNLILDKSVDSVKSSKVTFYIKDELTIKEIFDLILKTNDLVSIPYYENTFIIMTADEAQKNNKYSKKEYHVFKVINSKPSELLTKVFSSKIIADNINKDNIAHDDDKSIISIFDVPEKIKLLTSVVSKNDIKEQQVTIAVKLIDVNKAAKKTLGLNLRNLDNDSKLDKDSPFTLNVKNLGKISLTKLDATIDMLESDEGAKVIASPITRVVHNEQATIQSGRTIPVKDVKQNPQYEGGKIVGYTSEESWTSVNVGVELSVKPLIHNDGEITLDIKITDNDAPNVGDINVGAHFITTGRSTQTKLRLKDGETIVMGGFIKQKENGSQNKLMFFNQLPIIGKLFQKKSNSRSRDELIIFLSVYLVNKDPETPESEKIKISSDLLKYNLHR